MGDILGLAAFRFSASPLLAVPIFAILAAPFAVGLILLPVATRRTRDVAMRKHLRWFAYFVAFLGLGPLGVALAATVGLGAGDLFWEAMWAVSGYCLYRSAGSLIVVSKVPPDPQSAPQVPGAL